MAQLKKNLPITIILLGDPAAGKATQAEYLAKEYKLYDFDMGKELTRVRKQNAAISTVLNKNYDKGHLTPTKIVRNILKTTIAKIPSTHGILFDGHPKMLGEAKLANTLLTKQHRPAPLVIYLSIPIEETVKRMHDRVGYFAGKYGKRADDNVAGLKNRVKYYRKNIAEVINFFSSKYEFHKVSALGTRKQVQSRVEKIVRQYLKKIEDGEVH
jgi:adenylate kinase